MMKKKDLFIFFICSGILTSTLLFVGWRVEPTEGVYGDYCPISTMGRYYAKVYACNKQLIYASVPDGYCFAPLIKAMCGESVSGTWMIRDLSHSMNIASGTYVVGSPEWITPLRIFTFLLGCGTMVYFAYMISRR